MDLVKARSWWWRKQGFGAGLTDSAAILEKAGWARSVGGANPYVTLFARGGVSKQQAERDVAELKIHELPSARGCTYVLPREHFALGLKLAEASAEVPIKQAEKYLGVTPKEMEVLGEAVLAALQDGPMDPAKLKTVLGDKVRSHGEEGKKRGQSTTLPNALGRLQAQGKIRRVPINGRLDEQRYAYTLWNLEPYAGSSEDAHRDLAKLYFSWVGPAQLSHFQWFSALGVGAARKAIDGLGLIDIGDGWLLPKEDKDAWESFEAIQEPEHALVSSLDNLVLHRRDLMNFVDKADEGRQMAGEKALGFLTGAQDASNNLILDRGRLIGLWEYDPGASELIYSLFAGLGPDLLGEIERVQEFSREMGDMRSFSLDSPVSRKPKLDLLRSLQTTG